MRKQTYLTALVIFALIWALSCSENPEDKPILNYDFPYQLDIPKQTILLPDELQEVSGIALLPTGEFACVQDEEGFILIYDTTQQEINRTRKFGSKSDYEDIVVIGNDAYVLESDGTIRAILNFDDEAYRREKYKFPLTGNYNTEGLCYDKSKNRLLIASKNAGSIENAKLGRRQIFEFSFEDSSYRTKPVYSIDFNDVRAYFKHKGDTLGLKAVEVSGPMMVFKPSAIQINPVSNHIYLLSAYPPMLAILDHKTGELVYAAMLQPDVHPQPEGISFDPKGELWIASEGKNQKGRICGFSYSKE